MGELSLMGVSISELVASSPTGFKQLAGKKIAIDAYNTLYQFLTSIRQADGTPLMDSKGNPTGHLSGTFYRNSKLLEAGIRPIYVFDGIPPDMKKSTLDARKEMKLEAEEKFRLAREQGREEDARKYAARTTRLTKAMIEEVKELLGCMGIPCIQAPSEGEAQASALVANGLAYAVGSQDFDSLLFGAPLLLRNLSVSGKRKVPGKFEFVEVGPELVSLSQTLEKNGIERRQLIWLGILIGNDFGSGIKGIGPKKALKIVKECKALEDVVQYAKTELKYDFPENVFEIERFFLEPPVLKGSDVELALEFKAPDRQELEKFLCDKHDFSHERVERAAEALVKKFNDKTEQTGLGQWF
ncbi:flap endonuclease-1 [Candidatus Parvarchaeota archaeon]|nr:flap endonuclease-1 [Candidatus Parvarchaeota archaeon]